MRNLWLAIVMVFLSGSAHAERKSSIQIEDKIRVALKDIQTLQQANYAQHAAYKSTLAELNYSLPSMLVGMVSTTMKTNQSGLNIQMTGTAAPILGRKYSIDALGTISGLAQYSANKEVNEEINYLIKMTEVALKAYYDEWETYTDDLTKLGVVVPEHLRRFGTLKVTVDGSHYQVDFVSN